MNHRQLQKLTGKGIKRVNPTRDLANQDNSHSTARHLSRKPFTENFDKIVPEIGLSPGLYLIATPIGNLGDITVRGLETLNSVDAIACEDTRHTLTLLKRYGIHKPLFAYHDHNADRIRPQILQRLVAGERIALVSDAGSPLISDPGYKLVREAITYDIKVTTLPGPSSAIAALQLSGLPSDRFLFAGFLPSKSTGRRTALQELSHIPATLIIFEAPHRLADLLQDARNILGEREVAVVREITKVFEEVRRASLSELVAHYADAKPPKGEVVVVIGSAEPSQASMIDLDTALLDALQNSSSVRTAADEVALLLGLPRREVYRRALDLKKQRDDDHG